ncbi:MAG: sugar metabolism transcriptional regulator [Actinomycetia bacterium]|nr:sugar metabolism transcriptional regulator [Actinomycetes bacterium]MCP4083705.1 sugar metabolism transcriptional regulator [Actinomycetes bacterium]
MLSTIRQYLEAQQTASLAEIAQHVGADPGAVRGMVDRWVRKGMITRVPMACGGCTDCDPATIELYRWQGRTDVGESDRLPREAPK